MINKFVGDRFKLSYSITHTSGRELWKASAVIKGPEKEYKADCDIKDDNSVELLVTEDMYSCPGVYDVTFKNTFRNDEIATHFMQFSLQDHSGYKIEKHESDVADDKSVAEINEEQMEKETNFIVTAELLPKSDIALAGEEYENPLLTWIKLVFADNEPNANGQGIGIDEFANLVKSMSYMPIKADYNAESGLEGHENAVQIGVIKSGQKQANKVVAVGALYNDENPDVVEFFKKEFNDGGRVDFSWEIRYKNSETIDDVEWLKNITTKAITAVKNPAYQGRTPLISVSSLINAIDEELKLRGEMVNIEV